MFAPMQPHVEKGDKSMFIHLTTFFYSIHAFIVLFSPYVITVLNSSVWFYLLDFLVLPVIMPPSALDRLGISIICHTQTLLISPATTASCQFWNIFSSFSFSSANLRIDYPMLFELNNPIASRVTHCGVLEFVADEGLIYLPYWVSTILCLKMSQLSCYLASNFSMILSILYCLKMMENMLLQEGDKVQLKSTSLAKGTYVKLQPHTMDFLDISNPKAMSVISIFRIFPYFSNSKIDSFLLPLSLYFSSTFFSLQLGDHIEELLLFNHWWHYHGSLQQ